MFKSHIILFICLFSFVYLDDPPTTDPSNDSSNDNLPALKEPITLTTHIDIYQKVYNVTLFVEGNYLHFEFYDQNSFPSLVYEKKLSSDDLFKLSPKLFYDETLDNCLNIFSELFNDKKYSLVIVDDDLIVTFSPQVLNIKDFELTLTLKEITTKNAFRQLFEKAQELMDENEKLNKIISNNVLLISTQAVPLLTNLLHLNPIITHFSTLKPDFVLPKLNKDYLKKFKIILYDLQDCGYKAVTQKEIIKEYLMNGGNIILTHDHWTFIPTSISGMEELLGATLKAQTYTHVRAATVIKESHPIFNSYYNLNFSKGTTFTVSKTHHTDTIYSDLDVYARDLLIELNDNQHGEYLMVKEYGKGKIVFWNAGSTYDLTDIEQKLFYNILAYLSDV
jgi:hypothetical protein